MAVQRRVRQKARHVGAQAVRAETGAVRDGRFDVEVGFFVVELCLVDVDVFFVVVDIRLREMLSAHRFGEEKCSYVEDEVTAQGVSRSSKDGEGLFSDPKRRPHAERRRSR